MQDRDQHNHDETNDFPVDETDLGPQPAIVHNNRRENDAEPRNTNVEPHPTIDAEDAKDT